MDYEQDTRLAYRNSLRARLYKDQYSRITSWAGFSMRIERTLVEKALRLCELSSGDIILDIPCGTGLLGIIFGKLPAKIVAADISREMMELGKDEYNNTNLIGFAQGDITKLPFKEKFACVVCIGIMHRLTREVRLRTLAEIASCLKKFLIVSYSIDSIPQKIKKTFIKIFLPAHKFAPLPLNLKSILRELESNHFKIRKRYIVCPLLSAEIIFLLEKSNKGQP